MAEFIRGLFAIPSDVSSNYSLEELGSPGDASNGNGTPGAGGGGGRRHNRTLTPLSLSDGTRQSATSASFGEGTLSYGSGSADGSRGGASEHMSTESTSTETMEEHLHLGPMDLQYRHGEVAEKSKGGMSGSGSRGGERDGGRRQRAAAAATNGDVRGRQRGNDGDAPATHRSASEPRRGGIKSQRSHSMASSRRSAGNSRNMKLEIAGAGGGGSSRNMKLELNSPKKRSRRHRSASKMGARSVASSSHKGDPTLTRVNSWSSGEEGEGGRRHRRSSSRASSRKSSKSKKSDSKGAPPVTPGTQKMDEDNNINSSKHSKAAESKAADRKAADRAAAKKAKKKEKKEAGGWRSMLTGGMKKHLSPGSSTPEQKKSSSKSSAKSKNKHQNNSAMATPSPTNKHKKGNDKVPTSPGPYSPQPINVGDSIVISQQYLEEGMEMSVLTLPKELAAMNEDQAVAAEFDRSIMEVGQRCAMENDHVQRFLARHRKNERARKEHGGEVVPSSSTMTSAGHSRGPVYPKISEYASRVLEEGNIYQSYSQDLGEDPRDRDDDQPQDRDRQEEDGSILLHGESGVEVLSPGKHSWPCDPSADGYSPTSPDGYSPTSPDSIPPPPPPPPMPLPPRHERSPRLQRATASAVAAIPHFNTPINSNSESVTTSYDDPPGTLVTSPTLQTLQYSLSDPSEDPPEPDPRGDGSSFQRPFDEDSGFCGVNNNMQQHHTPSTPGKAMTPTSLNKRGSSKAVTFSLPPPSASPHPPAPPFMGPPLDYYYSMERDPDKDALPWMSNSPVLPPIIELWASVESADNVPGDVGGDVTLWDAERENALLGEDLPLHVSEELIDVSGKEEVEDYALDPSQEGLNPARNVALAVNNNDVQQQQMGFKKLSSTTSSSTWEANKHYAMDDTPHDEYFDDVIKDSHQHDEYFDHILNCRDDFAITQVKHQDDNNKATQQQLNQHGANLLVATRKDFVDEEDGSADFRHRSMWNTAYKPPKLSGSLEEDSYLPDGSSDGSTDKWQRLVRHRAKAATAIQKSARGMLERQRLRLLMDAVLVIQPCIRSYLSRKRYLDYLKVKRSYYPGKWERSNMAVAI